MNLTFKIITAPYAYLMIQFNIFNKIVGCSWAEVRLNITTVKLLWRARKEMI